MTGPEREVARQALAEYLAALETPIPIPASRFIISGMGASAVPGEVLADLIGSGPPTAIPSRSPAPPQMEPDRLVHIVLDVDHVAIGLDRANAPLAGGDRVDGSLIIARKNVVEDVVGDGAGRRCNADHGDASGRKNTLERMVLEIT